MGTLMEWFFDQRVEGAYTPTYNFSYQLADAENGQTEDPLRLLSLTCRNPFTWNYRSI